MRKSLIVSCFIIASAFQSIAQPRNDFMSYLVNYYSFHNNVQMVEVIFGFSDISVFEYEKRAMPWHVKSPDPTVYLFRDVNGKILKAYNLCGAKISDFELLPPKILNPKKILNHKISRYSILINCEPDTTVKNPWNISCSYSDAEITDAKYGLIDTMGNVIVEPQYGQAWIATSKNIVSAKRNGKYGILDENGKIIQPFVYDELECISYNGGSFLLKRKNKFSYANNEGKIISSREYDFGENFWSRRARVALKGKFGFIDSTGTEIVPLIYDHAEAFYYNVAVVKKGNKWGMINNRGIIIQPIEFDRIEDIYDEKEMVTTGYKGFKNGTVFYFDRDGMVVKRLN